MPADFLTVLVVDDSFLTRVQLKELLGETGFIKVVLAKDGLQAYELTKEVKPDVVLLDIVLPKMNGLEYLQRVMNEQPQRVIVFTGRDEFEGRRISIEAFRYGAVEVFSKPAHLNEFREMAENLVEKIKVVAEISPEKLFFKEEKAKIARKIRPQKLVIICASTGGPKCLFEIVPKIPLGIKAGFIINQHMPKTFTATFAERLNIEAEIKIREAEEADSIRESELLVVPGGRHAKLFLDKDVSEVKLKLIEKGTIGGDFFYCPSSDIILSSAAPIYRENLVAVVLTGMGEDGLRGCRDVKRYGGYVIAQDEKSSIVYGMPKAVAKAGVADKVLSPGSIVKHIVKIVESK
ncbi:MAG: chemotaxis-specific protein-glutamate methyltransferase CheB [Candidatus Omnitrophica bacterium]|nr:chemotaxis-specific protein-glutamate methyltransferase CheB [Candidatus Omnitrophota bacterium]